VLVEQPHVAVQVFERAVVLHAVFAGFTVAYLLFLLLSRRLPGPTRLDWPLAAVALVYAAASLDSVYPRASLEAVLLVAMVLVTFYGLHDFWPVRLEHFARGIVGVGVAGAVLGLASISETYSGWRGFAEAVGVTLGPLTLPPNVPRISGVGDHVNLLAMALNLALPFAFALVLLRPSLIDRVAGTIAAVLIALALFFTVSRGAWLGTAAALPVFGALFFFGSQTLAGVGRLGRVPRPALLATVFAAAVLIVLGAGVLLARWDSRPEWLFRASLSPRQDAAAVGIEIVRERPWLGAGPNSYAFLYNVYSGDYPIENIHAHNGYIQAAVNAGLFGVLAVSATGIVLVWALAVAYQKGDPRRRGWIAACSAAFVSLAVHSLTDSPNHSKTALLMLAAVLAFSMRLAPIALPPARSSIRNLSRLTALVVAPLLLLGLAYSYRGHSAYEDSLELIQAGEYAAATEQALEATRLDPDYAAYHFHAGVSQAILFLVTVERGGPPPFDVLDSAIDSFNRGLALERRSAVGWINLALALLLRGDGEGAVGAAHIAMLRAPSDGVIAGVAGTIYEWAGEERAAITAYSTAITHDAGLMQSPFWRTNEDRLALREAALANSFLPFCLRARVTAVYGSYDDDLQALADACRRQVESTPGDARARADLAVALYVLGRQEEALQESQRALDRAGDNAFVRTARGIVLAGTGDLAAVRKELFLGAYLGDPDAALLLRYTYAGAGDPVVLANLRWPSTAEPPPEEVVQHLAFAIPASSPMAFEYGLQRYLLGILYYRMRFFRESPPSILIPGEWIELASPRTLLLLRALEAGPAPAGE
jgi:O-antigen ligase/Flp pilus assembly protein TadD